MSDRYFSSINERELWEQGLEYADDPGLALKNRAAQEEADIGPLLEKGTTGMSRVVPPGGQPVSFFRLEATNSLACVITIQGGPPLAANVAGGGPYTAGFDLAWRVDMGSGGGRVATVEVDAMRGATFRVGGSFVEVSGVNNTGALGPGPTLAAQMSCWASYDAIPGAYRPPQRTVFVSALLAIGVASSVFPIPVFASSVEVVYIQAANVEYDLDLFQDAAGGVQISRYRFDTPGGRLFPQTGQPLAIPQGANFFSITPQANGVMTAVRAIFGLAL